MPHTQNPSDQTINFLRLIRSQNIGPHSFFTLIDLFGSAKAAVENIAEYSLKSGRKTPIKVYPESLALKEIYNCQKIGAKIITFKDEEYSKILREISDPPPVLTTLGDTSLLNRSILSIVGPRNSSFNGCKFAKKIACELNEQGFVIASGMARGIDSSAHQASLEKGTIAVLGGGIDNIYPSENKPLYQQIAQKGLIISENPFGYSPIPSSFPRRNRIVSGISLGVIVVEATIRSGTLITARCANEQGREVFAVPGSPFDPRCQGSNRLIKDGATLIENVDDITSSLIIPMHQNGNETFMEPEGDKFGHFPAKIPNQNDVESAQEIILGRLNHSFIAIDEITNNLQISTRIINVALMQLELSNKIENFRGKICLKA